MKMLEIKNLKAGIDDTEILSGIDLVVNPGEVHAIMGPNGSGKSTLAQVLAGHDDYEIYAGSVEYKGKNLLDLEPEERSREGIFLGFQYPVEIPGLNSLYFLRAAVNAARVSGAHPANALLGAIEKFETSLLRMPRRARSVLGMARAQDLAGNPDAAAEFYAELIDIRDRGANLPEVHEARRFLEDTAGGR